MKTFIKTLILKIIEWEARVILRKYKPRIIAVTGNVGKTSSKDAIYAALSESLFIRKSPKSYNSEFGVPLTIIGCDSGWGNPFTWIRNILKGLAVIVLKNHYPRWLVLEVGTDHPGDIKRLTRWLKPHIVVGTRMGDIPVHVEAFDSPEAVLAEKAWLVKALDKEGILVLNIDDKKIISLADGVSVPVLTYGEGKGAMVHVSNHRTVYKKNKPVGVTFKVDYDGKSFPIKLDGVVGKQYVGSVLSAIAIGTHLNINILKMMDGISKWEMLPGRVKIIEGIKDTIIIDDTYNASPTATEAALEVLGNIKSTGKKIAILGDMLELGKYAVDEHKKIGKLAGSVCDKLFIVGPRARYIAEGAMLGGMSEKDIREFVDSQKAGKHVERIMKEGDTILIKGSQGMRMEYAVQEIMAHPENRRKLLVRQEVEWQSV